MIDHRVWRRGPGVSWILVLCLFGCPVPRAATADEPVSRALAYLGREVPRWREENGCFSCHNNGDAARALMEAHRLGIEVPADALAETLDWLERPEDWDDNGGDGPFSDKRLARLQFTVALATAVEAGLSDNRGALHHAAPRMAGDQDEDGSWPVEAPGQLGSPATYGRALATWLARDVLAVLDPEAFGDAIRRADRWIAALEPRTVLDSAVILMATDVVPEGVAREAFEQIRRGQAEGGGWGPYVHAPQEMFDTALVVLALCRMERDDPERRSMIRRGREALVAGQLGDGSWIETTRPSGFESYAQRLSTTGWATLALLASLEPPEDQPAVTGSTLCGAGTSWTGGAGTSWTPPSVVGSLPKGGGPCPGRCVPCPNSEVPSSTPSATPA